MIVRWPGTIRAGAVSGLPWAFWDFLPTAAELAGAAPPQGLDGISVVPTLLGHGTQSRARVLLLGVPRRRLAAGRAHGPLEGRAPAPGGPIQLYDLRTDLGESRDVAAAHPDVVAKIEAYLATARTESDQWPMQAGKKAAGGRKKPAQAR